MYPAYRAYFDAHKAEPTDITIGLAPTYDSASRTGTLTVTVRNAGSAALAATLQCVVTENVYYPWGGGDSVHAVERAMLPSAAGEAINVPANDSVTLVRNFTLEAGWNAGKCNLVAFVQNSSKVILQGALAGVQPRPSLGFLVAPGTFARPGENVDFTPILRNVGTAAGQGITGYLSTTDPYVTVTQPSASWPTIGVARDEISSSAFGLALDPATPGGHVASLRLALTGTDSYVDTLQLPLCISPGTGFEDDIEGGTNGWTVSGLNSQWTRVTSRSHSPTYCWATTASGQYPNMTDMYLISPFFNIDSSAQLSFWHQYAVEPDYDYCMVELNGGGPFWQPVASYTGTLSSWTQQTFSLGRHPGATIRVRFRFISDSSVQGLGWFVDDVLVDPFVADVTDQQLPAVARVAAVTTPVRTRAQIGYSVPAGQTASLSVYDASGRIVATLGERLAGNGTASWDLTGSAGARVPAGRYFARLSGVTATVAKLVVTD
jgi:hypothetical protein